MTNNIYDAIDTDNQGTLEVKQVEDFTRDFLKGNQVEGEINTSFEEYHQNTFKILQQNESGELTLDELGKFLNELLKNQVIELQRKLEEQKYQRSLKFKKENIVAIEASAQEEEKKQLEEEYEMHEEQQRKSVRYMEQIGAKSAHAHNTVVAKKKDIFDNKPRITPETDENMQTKSRTQGNINVMRLTSGKEKKVRPAGLSPNEGLRIETKPFV